jgi:hypothetical protein
MGKKVKPTERVSGGVYEQLYKTLTERTKLETRLEEIKKETTDIAMMLCTEANMTEQTKGKTLLFTLEGTNDVMKVSRMDRLTITDPGVKLALEAAEMKYKASIKPFKAEYDARKKMIEVKASNEGRTKKVPSYYANIITEGSTSTDEEPKEE